MKSLGLLLILSLYFLNTNAQEINSQTIKGTWDYKSPKAKTKLSYKFDVDNKFTSITERKETETLVNGFYEFDKKENLDRLILNSKDKENSARTHTLYYFIKFIGPDTLKIQQVNSKQTKWLVEKPKNTMTFVRKKDEAKK